MAVGFVQLLASMVSGLLIDIVGRIPLLIISSVFMSLALASFGSYVHYDQNNTTGGNNDWIPLLCVLIFTIAFSLGELKRGATFAEFKIFFLSQEFHRFHGCLLENFSHSNTAESEARLPLLSRISAHFWVSRLS